MTFQRARSEEQREIRRRAILHAAAAMLDEMSVAEVSLNELSRRVGLAKSNVLRYFESREAVLLELLDDFLGSWLDQLGLELAASVRPGAPPARRASAVAQTLGRSLASRPVLCGLFGAQGGVLEHNVSVAVVARHKRSSLARLVTMTELVRLHLPELGECTRDFCLLSLFSAGALSAYVPAPASLLAAYAAEPELNAFRLELDEALRLWITSTLLGILPRR